jgi:hypothetical protein
MPLSVPEPTRRATVTETRHLVLYVVLDNYKIVYEFSDEDCTARVRILRPGEGSLLRQDQIRRGQGEQVICATIECGDKPVDIDLDFGDTEDAPILLAQTVEALAGFYHAEDVGSPNRKVLRMFHARATKMRASGLTKLATA